MNTLTHVYIMTSHVTCWDKLIVCTQPTPLEEFQLINCLKQTVIKRGVLGCNFIWDICHVGACFQVLVLQAKLYEKR
jgi:hypothetical protein